MTVRLERRGGLAILTIDNPPVNAMKTAVRARLMDLAGTLDIDPSVSAVVVQGEGRLFVAGADIAEFDRPPESPTLPELIARIEGATKPWIAALHGQALGGGLEFALGCRYRIAAPSTRLGMPEVSLGIIPGAGGTQRLPRLIGLEAAIPIIAEGEVLESARALDLGLVDQVVDGPLTEAVEAFATDLPGTGLPAAERALADPGPAFWADAAERIGKAAKGQAAPLAALEAVRHGVRYGIASGLAHERDVFLTLKASDESAALRYLFFAERKALRPADLREIAPRAVRCVGVVGGGTMGSGIAAALRSAGLTVILSERDAQGLDRGLATIGGLFKAAVKRGMISAEQSDARMAGVTGCVGLEGLAGCDLVVEAVFEDLAVKRAVFADLCRLCRAETILATNTSYINPRLIAEGLPSPDRFIGLHFFSPAQVMKLLEVIPLPETAPRVLATGFDLARRLGKVPVRSGICEGFIGNRILKRYRTEAESMLREGVPYADIDAAMRGFGYAMGPFEMQDMAGLDISFMNREAARARGEDLPETPGDRLVRAGRKGVKSGGGWYDYAPGDRVPRASAEAHRIIAPLIGAGVKPEAPQIVQRLIGAMAAEGRAILAENIADSAADIDLVQVHGYGFPRIKGGPMFHAGRVGA